MQEREPPHRIHERTEYPELALRALSHQLGKKLSNILFSHLDVIEYLKKSGRAHASADSIEAILYTDMRHIPRWTQDPKEQTTLRSVLRALLMAATREQLRDRVTPDEFVRFVGAAAMHEDPVLEKIHYVIRGEPMTTEELEQLVQNIEHRHHLLLTQHQETRIENENPQQHEQRRREIAEWTRIRNSCYMRLIHPSVAHGARQSSPPIQRKYGSPPPKAA